MQTELLDITKDINKIIEPFIGEGDLIKFIRTLKKDTEVVGYDIDPKLNRSEIKNLDIKFTKQNTLLKPPNYSDKNFIITNPPYLARNKNNDKFLYDKFKQNDLYKIFIYQIMNHNIQGGLIIIPLNFFCSIRENDIKLRRLFITEFHIVKLNIFEEDVFSDTSYSVCSVLFQKRNGFNYDIKTIIYPSKKHITLNISESNNYTIGGELYSLDTPFNFYIKRFIINDELDSKKINTKLKINCIDSGTLNGKINMLHSENIYYGKESSRTEASLYIGSVDVILFEKLKKINYQKIGEEFNTFFNLQRNKYNSLFMSNYRESKQFARKRVSFYLVYTILKFLITENLKKLIL